MLSELQIRDFAIVDHLYLTFNDGMTVFTGETGAGKSIAIDALGLALGDRAESTVVREGSKRAEVIASFDISRIKGALRWLNEHELDAEQECILRRTISSEGGSRAYINGRPVPVQLVRELADMLIDIHSQHQHQSLLRPAEQRALLDSYAGCEALARELATSFKHWQQTTKQLDELAKAEKDRQSRIEFLKFQIDELETLAPQPNEWDKLEQEHRSLANIDKIEAAVSEAIDLGYENNHSVVSSLTHISTALQGVMRYHDKIAGVIEMVNTASVQVEEAIADLRSLIDDSEMDQGRFQWLEERIGQFVDLSRKHYCKPSELFFVQQNLQDELDELLSASTTIEHLERDIRACLDGYQALATRLTDERHKAGEKLSKEVTKHLSKLGMAGARFKVVLNTFDDMHPSLYGNESVAFEISTNAGQSLKPLSKVASGGELSRISLVIQVVTAQVAKIPSLVFDEVDVGIGGAVAEVVGSLLRRLGDKRQVLCITHQPQVASQGHHHFLVSKHSNNKSTTTRFTGLDKQQRIEEVARMLGGVNITDTSREHAQEMLEGV